MKEKHQRLGDQTTSRVTYNPFNSPGKKPWREVVSTQESRKARSINPGRNSKQQSLSRLPSNRGITRKSVKKKGKYPVWKRPKDSSQMARVVDVLCLGRKKTSRVEEERKSRFPGGWEEGGRTQLGECQLERTKKATKKVLGEKREE